MTVADRGTRARSEVPAEETWDLTAIYPDAESWEADLKRVREQLPELVAARSTRRRASESAPAGAFHTLH